MSAGSVRPPPEGRREAFVRRMLEIADDDSHGYSQRPPSGRWGPDYDCSSLIYAAADEAGYPVGTGRDRARFTGTMLGDFTQAGYLALPYGNVGIDNLEVGDILLNIAVHSEVYVGDRESVGATASEDGGSGGTEGDQTGTEIERHPVDTFKGGWDYVLRPPSDDGHGKDYSMNYGPMQNGQQQMWPGGYPQQTAMPGRSWNTPPMQPMQQAQQGQQQMVWQDPLDLTYVMGIEGARMYHGTPNGRAALFDEDKLLMYLVELDGGGCVREINVYRLIPASDEVPQHLSPLMRQNMHKEPAEEQVPYVTWDEFERLKEMVEDAKPAAQETAAKSRRSKSTASASAS